MEAASDKWFLYIIAAGKGGPVKIGHSRSPESRLTSLQSGNPKRLNLIWTLPFESRDGAKSAERTAHQNLDCLRMEGEWFDIDRSGAIAATEAELGMDGNARAF